MEFSSDQTTITPADALFHGGLLFCLTRDSLLPELIGIPSAGNPFHQNCLEPLTAQLSLLRLANDTHSSR